MKANQKIDKNRFFREICLAICSSLDFCHSLGAAHRYLATIMPLEHIHLNLYQGKNEDIWTFTQGAQDGVCQKCVFSPADNPGVHECLERYAELNRKGVLVYQTAERSPLGSVVAPVLGYQGRSIMVMHLNIGEHYLGSVVVTARQGEEFTEEHAELLNETNEPFGIAVSNAMTYEQLNRIKERLADDNRFLNKELKRTSKVTIIGDDGGLQSVMEMVEQVGHLNNSVLLLGETGVGKEIIANAIHQASPRRDGPMIKVNCGAIPSELIDSELFGHEKGAFTGATSRKLGRFERASGGTILLDEIGELPMSAQVRLLRVLQSKEIERVGGVEAIPVDIRVISATHRNLAKMIMEGTFRKDLWFRLNVFPIEIPALRQRREDIIPLMHHFMNLKATEMGMRPPEAIDEACVERLIRYDWPGNVRELENVIERALIKSRGKDQPLEVVVASVLTSLLPEKHAPEPVALDSVSGPVGFAGTYSAATEVEGALSLDDVVARQIEKVLELTKGKVNGAGGAAEILQIHPSTLRHKMEKLGIVYGRGRGH
ncbi:MAG: sigma 54-interacting transcriptional regulator [Desulfuromonadales bacterium]|nr:sigma 54-interacting transcriptional regulator [Desulfuromonadales bacterium]